MVPEGGMRRPAGNRFSVAAPAGGRGDGRMKPVSLVVPVYNEAASCGPLVQQLRRLLDHLPQGSEVLVVDDGSTDGSAAALDNAMRPRDPFRLLHHARNRGYGAALKTGIAAARHDWIAIVDADGTYPLGALPKLLRETEQGAAMAVGVRPAGDLPAARRPAKSFLNRYASFLAGSRIPDLNSGLRVFRRADAVRFRRLLPDGFSFTSTLTMALAGEGERIAWVPIRYRARVGRSKIRPVRDLLGFLLLVSRLAMTFNPLRVLGPAGVVLIAAGSVLLAMRVVLAAHPFGLATTIILFVGGLQLLGLGLLADLVNRRASHD